MQIYLDSKVAASMHLIEFYMKQKLLDLSNHPKALWNLVFKSAYCLIWIELVALSFVLSVSMQH